MHNASIFPEKRCAYCYAIIIVGECSAFLASGSDPTVAYKMMSVERMVQKNRGVNSFNLEAHIYTFQNG